MISVADAIQRIVAALPLLPPETVSITEALGRVLAEPLVARTNQPPVNIAMMDGYAVRGEDCQRRLPVRLRVIGQHAAGHTFRGAVHSGEAVRIFTGATMPSGTNAIIRQETVTSDDDDLTITVTEATAPGTNIRPAGLDFQIGQICLPAGRALSPRDIGLAAAMTYIWLPVRRRPRVAILATGDEVMAPGEPLNNHQVINANTPALMALVQACGGVPINLGIARDTPDSLLAAAAAAEGTDLLVTSGGASEGETDLIYRVLGNRGLSVDFWTVATRPGRPLLFGRAGSVPLLGLPGNPVSCQVTALLFLRPALRALLGQSTDDDGVLRPAARLTAALPANDARQTYLRATLCYETDGMLAVTPFARQDSAMLTALASAHCLIIRPPGAPAAQPGDLVTILPLGDGLTGV